MPDNIQQDCSLHLFPKRQLHSASDLAAALEFKERPKKPSLFKAASAPAMPAPLPPAAPLGSASARSSGGYFTSPPALDLRSLGAALPASGSRRSPTLRGAGGTSPKHRLPGAHSPKSPPTGATGRASPKAFAVAAKRGSPKFGSETERGPRSPPKAFRGVPPAGLGAGAPAPSIVVRSSAPLSGSSPLRRATGMAASVPLLHLG